MHMATLKELVTNLLFAVKFFFDLRPSSYYILTDSVNSAYRVTLILSWKQYYSYGF